MTFRIDKPRIPARLFAFVGCPSWSCARSECGIEFKGTIKKPEAAHAEGDDCWRGRIGEIHAGALVGRADGPACRHLDQVHWMPHWTPRPSKEHLEMVRAFEKEEG